MAINIEQYAQEAHEFVNTAASEMGLSDNKEKAGRILRAVLHAIRDRVTSEEAMHLCSQFPIIIKGVFVENWKINKIRKEVESKEDFINLVKEEEGIANNVDFQSDEETLDYISAVIRVVHKYTTEGQEDHVKGMLPKAIKELWETSVAHH